MKYHHTLGGVGVWIALAMLLAHRLAATELETYLELEDSRKGTIVENMDLDDKEIKDVVALVGKWTGKNFMLDPKISGRISILAPSGVSLEEAYRAFLSALFVNRLTTVNKGKFIQIIPIADAAKSPIATYTDDSAPTDDRFLTQVFQLKHLSAEAVRLEFRDMVSAEGKIMSFAPTNSLIVADTGSNVRRLKDLFAVLDVKTNETTLHVVPVKNHSSRKIADMLAGAFDEKKANHRGGGIITKVLADEQTNNLVILANEAGVKELRRLVSQIDVKVTDNEKMNIYYCENAKAEDLALTLSAFFERAHSEKNGTKGTAPAIEGAIKVTADMPTNSLVIVAAASDYGVIKQVIRKLDLPRLQVYLESAILELKVTDQKDWNPNLGVMNGTKFNGGFVTSTSEQLTSILNGGILSGATVPFVTPLEALGGGISNLTGILNFIATNTRSSLLSTPSVTALNHQEALLRVQDEIPIYEGFAANGATGNVSRKRVGLQLKITPHISENTRLMRLDIEQTVEDVNNQFIPGQVSKVSVRTTSRVANTKVVLRDGEFVVMGGLMAERVREEKRQVPVLGDIPVLGWLFKSESKEVEKTNLILLLLPKIIGPTSQSR